MTAPTLDKIIIPERPGEDPSALPGDELLAIGKAFGSKDVKSTVLVGTAGVTPVPADILDWSDQQIRFRFPDGLGEPGPKAVRIGTRQGQTPPKDVKLEEPLQLEAAPVALLPLGLQTRFTPDGGELWIRAIPDTVHVDSHDERLTTEELALGQRYHTAGTRARDVWLDLTLRFGAPRAEWIVRATGAATVLTRDQPWGRVARTRLLPRRLHAFAYDENGQLVAAQHGRPIPLELPIGPDPDAPPDAKVTRDPGMAWMVDFDAALARGMAIKLRLPPGPLPRHIAKLVVLGVETALTADQGASELGNALAAHRYTRGIGFLPEGTPTNVAPDVAAGPDDAAPEPPPDVPEAPAADTNADATARALGLLGRAAELFADTPYAGDGDGLRGARRHMNAALWPATWGYFLEQMMASLPPEPPPPPPGEPLPPPEPPPPPPFVPPDAIEPARKHFVSWVRGCGPQPVLRIGRQPYGLLPVLPLAHWMPYDPEPQHPELQELESQVEPLAQFLDGTLRPIWSKSVDEVPRVSQEPPTAISGVSQEHPLFTVLSMQPRSISFRGRSVLAMPFVDIAWRFIRNALTAPHQQLDDAWRDMQAQRARTVLDQQHLLDSRRPPYLLQTVFSEDYFPVKLPLVHDASSPSAPLPETWLAVLRDAGWQKLRQDKFYPDKRPLLYLLVRHSLLVAYLSAAAKMAPAVSWRDWEQILYGIDEVEEDPTAKRPEMAWDLLTALVEETAPSKEPPGRTKGDQLDDPLDDQPRPPLTAVRESITQLAKAPVAVLENATAETLDLCSHRLDAWISSFAQRRLQTIRGDQAAGGLLLGAYGFVEDIKQGDGSTSAGYVHTPSLTHAAAAAILASGYRSHPDARGPSQRRAFGIDLSSARVRVALSLLDGVRAGEQLGALLGYRLERSLHEQGFAHFIDDLRVASPLPVTGTAPRSPAAQAASTANVVDALELHRLWVTERKLPADWPSHVLPSQQEVMQSELQPFLMEIDDAIDAMGDVLLTEGVYQLARGDAERSAAALRAAAQPSATPPELEAIGTPHAGIATVHRLAVLLPGDVAPAEGWSQASGLARREAEPRLDAWAGLLLGAPKRVHFRVQYHDAVSGAVLGEEERRLDQIVPALSALDVVYTAVASEQTQLSELEQRIVYHAVRNPPAGIPPGARARVIDSREPESEGKIGLLELMELAQALRETLGGARSITPDDLSVPEKPGTAVVEYLEVEPRAARAADVLHAADKALGDAIAAADKALTGAAGEALRTALLAASAIGVLGAVPLSAFGDDPAALSALKVQAGEAQANVQRRIAELEAVAPAPDKDYPARAECAVARIQAVFGKDFRAVPSYSAPLDKNQVGVTFVDVSFASSAALQGNDAFAATVWFQRLTRVRDGARRLGDTLLYADALGGADTLHFQVAQLPAVPGDRWLALPFVDNKPPTGRVSLVAHLPVGPFEPARKLAGLLIEHLTEVWPAPVKTTGLAFHYDQPNAAPPQLIVLAVPPQVGQDWTQETLVAVVNDTLELAKLRMVDLNALQDAGHFVPATYLAFNTKGVTAATNFNLGRGIPLG